MAKRQNQDNEPAERPDAVGSNPSSNEERLRGAADDSFPEDVDGDSDLEDAEDVDEEEEDSEGNF